MKLTNKYGMPPVFFSMIREMDAQWSRGGSGSGRESYGVTTLASSPWRTKLMKMHGDDLVEDVRDRFFAFRGQMMHKALEDVPLYNMMPELRIGMEIDGAWLAGRIDVISPGKIEDHKMGTVNSVFYHDDDKVQELARQLNVYRYMVWKVFTLPIYELAAQFYLMDWVGNKALTDSTYPQKPHFEVPVPLWTLEETEAYIMERIALHRKPLEELEPCSPKERWARPASYALKSPDLKRASKVGASREEVEKWMVKYPTRWKPGSVIEERPGEDIRCARYCGVSGVCPYFINKNAALTE